ncbi:hypothetical protein OAA91_01920, partial [Fibrobacterales bacterium]|nr:hypothetical protein [Fibrobacterales bacterium]
PEYKSPTEMDENEIQQRYDGIWVTAIGNYNSDIQASLLAIEMNRRLVKENSKENEKLTIENQKLALANQKLTRLSIAISFFALFFALISAVLSFLDWKGDYSWQKNQLALLNSINKTQIIKPISHCITANETADSKKKTLESLDKSSAKD